MAVIGYNDEALRDLLDKSVAELPFENEVLRERIIGKLEEIGVVSIGELLQTKMAQIFGIYGFGEKMRQELFSALAKLSIYRDGEEPAGWNGTVTQR